MGEILKTEAVVSEGRVVHLKVATPDWPEGTRVRLTLEPVPPEEEKVPLSTFFGKGKKLFGSTQEVVDFIREERNSWDRRGEP